MPNDIQEGKKPTRNGNKQLRKKRILRLLLILAAIFVFVSAIAGFATYKVVSAYMAELPEFDFENLMPAQTSFIYDKDGVEVTPLMSSENRIGVSLDEISPDLIDAFIATEDERFYEHPGFDIRGIIRAAYNNVFNKNTGMQGGSTITQQLVKNAFLTRERTMKRKIQELYLSYQLERMFSKEEILEFYLNRIFFDFNAYGVEAAAQTYFGKSAKDVTLAEAAILAGIPNWPERYSPLRNFEESKNRQSKILARMVETNTITAEEAAAAREEEITLMPPPKRTYPYPYFVNYVIHDELLKILGSLPEFKDLAKNELFSIIYEGGLRVYTTLDQEKQKFVEDTLSNPELYPNLKPTNVPDGVELPPIQAAAMVTEPTTGYIVAMVGGRDYDSEENVINRAVRGRMQAGSVLKPILAFAPAFNEKVASPATVIDDSPTVWKTAEGTSYTPNNYDRTFLGLITARFSLIRSRNVPAVYLLDELGVDKGKEYAQRMGITSFTETDAGLGMVVGGLTKGVSVYEVTQAYSVLANEGVRTDLTSITKITDSSGNIIYEHTPNAEEVLTPQAAWLTTSILEDVVTHAWGTAAGLRVGRPIAAKTGTSENNRDVWLATYTPDYVSVFWIGRDSWPDANPNKKIDGRFVSGRHSNPFMNPIIKFIHEGLPKKEFKRPDGLRRASVCNKSGLRPGEFCPSENIVSDWFLPDQIPGQTCEMHIEVEVCKESGLLAGEFCPDELKEIKVFLDRPEFIKTDGRWAGAAGRVPADADLMPPKDTCDKHTSRPGDPSEPKASAAEDGTVTLSWKAGSGASGYLVSRKNPGSDAFTLLTATPTGKLNFVDKQLQPGSYSYQIVAINSEGVKSSGAATVSVTVAEPPPPPPPAEEEPGDGNDSGSGNGNGSGNNGT